MMKQALFAAVAATVVLGGFGASAVQAKGKGGHNHHRHHFFRHHHFQTFEPICGKWVWSKRRDRFVCVWWY